MMQMRIKLIKTEINLIKTIMDAIAKYVIALCVRVTA